MTPAFTVAIRSASLSTPSVLRPRSAKLSASGRPTRPRPITETSYSKGCSVNSSSLTPGAGQTLGAAAILERGTACPLPSVLAGGRRPPRGGGGEGGRGGGPRAPRGAGSPPPAPPPRPRGGAPPARRGGGGRTPPP